ncbi:PBP1A family penicillin-binding protein [bacterium]|nr:PBP1A family penicillin-binding protein [bacterium]
MKLLKIILICLFSLGTILTSWVFLISLNLPDPTQIESFSPKESSKIFDRNGNLLYEIYGEEKRTIIPLDEIPKKAILATIAIEDRNFFSHPAFDIRSILRAIFYNILHLKFAQGASTITQQLARNAFLVPEKTLTRKIREIILAIKIEKKYPKEKILELYLNQIPYGNNCYGIEAASKNYFDKKAKDLTLAESALLAALPKAPSFYNPYGKNLNLLLERKNLVLKKMKEYGFISEEEFEKAIKEEIKFKPPKTKILAPHFVIYVKRYLEEKYGEKVLKTKGLRVITTLDLEVQKMAEEAIKWGVERNRKISNAKNAAMVVEDAKNGQILAMVGSYDYFDIENQGNYNCTLALRQPGSAFKPFAYLQSFLKGYNDKTIVFDLKTEFNTSKNKIYSYQPKNFDKIFRGPVSLRNALAQSINVPSVKVLYLAGIKETIELAKKLGIKTLEDPNRYGLSLVLGGGEVRLIDLVQSYSVFAQEGIYHPQSFILEIKDNQGKILEKWEDKPTLIIKNQEAVRLLNDILKDNKARAPLFGGENNLVQINDREIAAKTGTTQDTRDAWIIAYTPSYVVGIWVGNNDNSPMLRGSSILLATPIWNYFAKKFFEDKPKEEFRVPKIEYPKKPMLNGTLVGVYKVNERYFPQIHNILWYVDKNNPLGKPPKNPESDPQFRNWEKPVKKWIKKLNINLEEYNQKIPYQAKLNPITVGKTSKKTLKILEPKSGDFISKTFYLKIELLKEIESLKIFFNKNLLKEIKSPKKGKNKIKISPKEILPQNLLEIEFKETNKTTSSKETLILFSEQ